LGELTVQKPAGHYFGGKIIANGRPMSGVAMPRRRNRCKNACEHNCKKLHMKACQRFARLPAARPGQKRSTTGRIGRQGILILNEFVAPQR
jgi:hypothetical protein